MRMTLFDLFLDIYGHQVPVLNMLRNIIDITNYSEHSILKQMQMENNYMKQMWYRAALYCQVSSDKLQTIRTRCRAENSMRMAWTEFVRARLVEMPEVPPVPG